MPQPNSDGNRFSTLRRWAAWLFATRWHGTCFMAEDADHAGLAAQETDNVGQPILRLNLAVPNRSVRAQTPPDVFDERFRNFRRREHEMRSISGCLRPVWLSRIASAVPQSARMVVV